MSLLTVPNSWGWIRTTETNTNDTPISTPGVALTAGAVGVKGAWTNISTYNSVNTLDVECHFVTLEMHGRPTSTLSNAQLVDIGVDPAGGSSPTLVASNIAVGQSAYFADTEGVQVRAELPLCIPAGASVFARTAFSPNAANSAALIAAYFGAPSRPEAVWSGQFCESIGIANDGSVPTNCDATPVTPGNSGSWTGSIGTAAGDWHELGTAAQNLRHISLFPQIRNATMAALHYFWELGIGDGATVVPIIKKIRASTTSSERVVWKGRQGGAFFDIPAGTKIYARANCSGTSDTGWTAMALGIGG
jgi:hypothetical protein